MREILKEVVNEQGLQILQTPAMLRAKLEEKGDDRSDALLWELILTACPSVADVAVQPELSRAEVNTVIGAVTKTTMLSASLVRRMVQQLLDAAQVKLSPVPRFLILANGRHGGACSVEDQREGEALQAALASLETDTETASATCRPCPRPGTPMPATSWACTTAATRWRGWIPSRWRRTSSTAPRSRAILGLWRPGGLCAERAAKESSPGGQYFGYPTSLAVGTAKGGAKTPRTCWPIGSRTSAAEDRPYCWWWSRW